MPVALSHIFTILMGLGSVLLIAAASLRVLNVVKNRESKEQLSKRVREFWVETAELAGQEKLHLSLEARYGRMKSLRYAFLKLFWFFCFVVLFATLPSTWEFPHEKRVEAFNENIKLDFSFGYVVRCFIHFNGSKQKAEETAKICDAENREAGPKELAIYLQREKNFKVLVEQMSHGSALLSAITTTAIVIIILAAPLSLALYISFNFTLWLLRRITRSKLHYAFLVGLDLFVALAAPPIITSFCLLLLFGIEIVAVGSVIDLSSFDSANWLTLAFGIATLGLNAAFVIPVVVISLGNLFTGMVGVVIIIATYLIAPIWMGVYRMGEFATAVVKILNLDFSNDILESIIDWAIFTDVMFSLFYLLPSVLLVLANRSEKTREAFLNVVMYVGDHKDGPYTALADMLSTTGEAIKKIITGKPGE